MIVKSASEVLSILDQREALDKQVQVKLAMIDKFIAGVDATAKRAGLSHEAHAWMWGNIVDGIEKRAVSEYEAAQARYRAAISQKNPVTQAAEYTKTVADPMALGANAKRLGVMTGKAVGNMITKPIVLGAKGLRAGAQGVRGLGEGIGVGLGSAAGEVSDIMADRPKSDVIDLASEVSNLAKKERGSLTAGENLKSRVGPGLTGAGLRDITGSTSRLEDIRKNLDMLDARDKAIASTSDVESDVGPVADARARQWAAANPANAPQTSTAYQSHMADASPEQQAYAEMKQEYPGYKPGSPEALANLPGTEEDAGLTPVNPPSMADRVTPPDAPWYNKFLYNSFGAKPSAGAVMAAGGIGAVAGALTTALLGNEDDKGRKHYIRNTLLGLLAGLATPYAANALAGLGGGKPTGAA